MGEFLLSYLGFDHEGTIIFTRRMKGSRYNIGDPVPFVYPNQDRKTKRVYYRILEKFYEPEKIVRLLETRDPNVIDNDGRVPYQRILLGGDMYRLTLNHHSFAQIGKQYGWSKHAVEYAIHKYLEYEKNKSVEVTIEDEPKLTPEQLTAEQLAKREALLAQWD
jgi:hypothetical protein